MDIDYDFSDVSGFFPSGMKELHNGMIVIGEDGVEYAKQHGNYRDKTGRLRSSNKVAIEDDTVILTNDAKSPEGVHYASFVESKGYDVLGKAALYVEKKLKEKYEL